MRILYTLLLYYVALCVHAQGTVIYDVSSGLPHWVVSGISQDRQGFIWVATWNGLCRYDGYEFLSVKATPGDGTSINSEVIRSMERDDDDNIVCHTSDGGFVFDTRQYRLYKLAQDTKGAKLCSPYKFTDSEGNVWEKVRYGIAKTVSEHHPAVLVEGTENRQARAFMKDKDRQWWLATKEDESIRIFDVGNRLWDTLGQMGYTF